MKQVNGLARNNIIVGLTPVQHLAFAARQGSGKAAILMPPPQGHDCVDNILYGVALRHRLLLPDADLPLQATTARTCQK
eukprot:6163057-Prorocentrum_lima.AAC.1